MILVNTNKFLFNKTRIGYILLYLLLVFLLYVSCLSVTDNIFVFTLDDPYIHLAVAENITRGVNGINLQEFSSPNSSILFPYLLAGLLKLNFSGNAAAFLLNIIPSIASVKLLIDFYANRLVKFHPIFQKLFPLGTLLLILSINAIALPFTGMEHSLHVFITITFFIALINFIESKKISPSFYISLVLLPLIRFEGFALLCLGLLALLYEKRFKAFAIVLLIVSAIILSYFYYMHSLGLPLLPSSVLVKSETSASLVGRHWSASFPFMIKQFFIQAISLRKGGIVFSLMVLFCLYHIIKDVINKKVTTSTKIAFLCGASLFAHLLLGQFAAFFRYEVYAVAIIVLSLPILIENNTLAFKCTVLFLILGSYSARYFFAVKKSPPASKNIYEQQVQMHFFATKYFPYNVAVNDLGLVSYKNDNYVLDLWGLGSEQVRKLKKNNLFNKAAVNKLALEKNVAFAMVFDIWFENTIPNEWLLAGQLITSKAVTPTGIVSFYLIDTSKKQAFKNSLIQFQSTLPKGANLSIKY